jgi:APA family basic amino acid/polyamine antiporter
MFGFLYGWTLFSVIQTGTIAAVSVAFAKFAGVFFPVISASNVVLTIGSLAINTQQLLGVSLIIFLSLYNYREVKSGAFLQNIFTVAKVGALVFLIGAGLYYGFSGGLNFSNFSPAFPDVMTLDNNRCIRSCINRLIIFSRRLE